MRATLRRLVHHASPEHEGAVAEEWSERGTWRYRRRKVLLRRTSAGVIMVAPALVLVALLLGARSHYALGREALAAGQYERAAGEFAAASVLSLGYRDAEALGSVAARMATDKPSEVRVAPSTWPLRYRLLLARARRELRDRNFVGASLSVSALRRDYPAYPLDLGRHATRLAEEGATVLLASASQRFREGRWNGARRAATASLYLDPGSEWAFGLEQRAYRYMSAEPLVDEARTLARSGAWADALDVLERAVVTAPDYPEAKDLLRQARAARGSGR